MPRSLLTIVVPGVVVVVVAAIFGMLWRERTSAATSRVAVIGGLVLAAWAAITARLAVSGFFLQCELHR